MDYEKIGNFLSSLRKEHNLTQAKLAEKVFVSEKTISKWENGKSLPDTESLPLLCETLNITINELLSGERTSKEDNLQNQQLLLDMTNEIKQKNKTIWTSMWAIMGTSLTALIFGILLSFFLIPEGAWQIVAIVGFCVIFLIPCFYALRLELSVGAYQCKKCGCKIIPSYQEALWAMHRGTTRYLKCPKCNKRSWCKKVVTK